MQVNDNDDIKRALLLQLPHVIDNMKNQPSGYEQIRDILTPALFLLIANENLDVKRLLQLIDEGIACFSVEKNNSEI